MGRQRHNFSVELFRELSKQLAITVGHFYQTLTLQTCIYGLNILRFLSVFFYTVLSQWEFFPWEIQVAFFREKPAAPE